MQEILVNVDKQRNKTIVVVENGRLVEKYQENDGAERLEGNIYIGKVQNVLLGMQAAFVDIGKEKNTFIHIRDVMPKASNETGNKNEPLNKYNIKDYIRTEMPILVQVKKDSTSKKGARVSTHMNISGRYIVLMPNSEFITVSKKIEDIKEKNRLLNEIKNGNKEAREEFINGNLKLVLSVIKRFYGRGENLDDLFQIGCIGLIKAMDNFDLDLNVQFSTYAVPMIAGEIRRYLRDNNMVRVSRSVRDLAYKVLAVREKALRENKKEPTIDEIAKELGVEKEEIAFCLDAIQDPVSLQEPVYGDDTENIYVEDQIKDKKNSDENWADDITLLEVMKKLKEKERNIINKRFFEGRTQMEVAEEIGISQAQVSRLEKNAIEHIKKLYN